MSRRSVTERINSLDLETCRYTLGIIAKGVPFSVALQSAEKTMKKKGVEEVPGQTVLA